ncbi:hypothetical protein B1201_05370 [Acinetobacter sp. ANC 5600]|nr:hypothetical protein B1201_05370 [Acinetobacter sp. ANC 5600]
MQETIAIGLHKTIQRSDSLYEERCEKQFCCRAAFYVLCCKKMTGFEILNFLSKQYKREHSICQFINQKNTLCKTAYFRVFLSKKY